MVAPSRTAGSFSDRSVLRPLHRRATASLVALSHGRGVDTGAPFRVPFDI